MFKISLQLSIACTTLFLLLGCDSDLEVEEDLLLDENEGRPLTKATFGVPDDDDDREGEADAAFDEIEDQVAPNDPFALIEEPRSGEGPPEHLMDLTIDAPPPLAVTAGDFAVTEQSFSLVGSGTKAASLSIPLAYTHAIPIVQIRRYQVGDMDYAFNSDYSRAGSQGNFKIVGLDAPANSYGVDNVVAGRFSVLALSSGSSSSSFGQPVQIKDNQQLSWPTTTFAQLTQIRMSPIWSIVNGLDDDFSIDTWRSGSFYAKASGGNGNAFSEVQKIELGVTSSMTAKLVSWTVFNGNSQSKLISRNSAKKFAVIAGADSYYTCGADQVSFNVVCTDATSSSSCSLNVWGGDHCSYVDAYMLVLEDD